MLRVYCDTNVFSFLKKNHPKYTQELKDTFDNLSNKLLFTFSDAHLDDLHNSKEEYRNEDLLLMERYVKDNYFTHDYLKEKKTFCNLNTPYRAYHDKDYDSYNAILHNPFNISSLFTGLGLENDEIGKGLQSLVNTIFNMPINSDIHKPKNLDEKGNEWFNKFIPSFQTSHADQINHMFSYSHNLLNESTEVSELRKYVESYMKREDYSFEKWGEQFDNKLKETPLGQSFSEIFEKSSSINNKDNNIYDRFILYYNMLELFNVTTEKSGGKTKKFGMSSLNTDAHHAWYGSFSDYLVTDDKGLQVKAFLTYRYFHIPTKIIALKDFHNYKSTLEKQEESYESLEKALEYDLEKAFQMYQKNDLINYSITNTYKTTYPYFNYFNRLQTYDNNGSLEYALYCDRADHSNSVMLREVEILTNKMIKTFGTDINGKREYNFKQETNVNENIVRQWGVNNKLYSLLLYNYGGRNFLTLQICLFK